jgi:hypothetical protein
VDHGIKPKVITKRRSKDWVPIASGDFSATEIAMTIAVGCASIGGVVAAARGWRCATGAPLFVLGSGAAFNRRSPIAEPHLLSSHERADKPDIVLPWPSIGRKA